MFHFIGHRGISGLEAENTMPSFERAYQLGFDEVELDVRLTKDGRAVVIHDESLDRLTYTTGFVNNFNINELQQIEIRKEICNGRDHVFLTSLKHVLYQFRNRLKFHIELKDARQELLLEVINQIKTFNLEHSVYLTSLYCQPLLQSKSMIKDIQCGWIMQWGDDKVQQFCNECINTGFHHAVLDKRLITKSIVADAHKRGLYIRAYGVETNKDIWELVKIGCDGATIKHDYNKN